MPLILLSVAIAAILLIFAADVGKMVEIWWTSSTFTHCLFILPLVAWLIWQRRREVAVLIPQVWPPGLILLGIAGLAWVVGAAAGVSLIRHASIILMIQASVLCLLGPRVTRGLLFPLFYLLFLVPFGEELVPPMQTITAKLCMIFLGWAGIPAHIEGVFISLPNGNFEVAEACSGVKFLVAMFAYGVLVINVCFRNWWRRAGFLAVALIVPIIANGIRAYGTIHISYLTSNDFAAGFDHVVYGWFFFALVMIAVIAIGWRFFDRRIDDPWLTDMADIAVQPVSKYRPWMISAVIATAVLPALWNLNAVALARSPLPHQITLPRVAGWQHVGGGDGWAPRFDGADHRLQGDYINQAGQRVTLAIALYAWQDEGKEIVGYGQGAADPRSHWSWANDTVAPKNGKAERIFAPGAAREVVSFYRISAMTTGNARTVKLATLVSRLLARDQSAVALLISAQDQRAAPGRPVIDAFAGALGSPDVFADALIAKARGQ